MRRLIALFALIAALAFPVGASADYVLPQALRDILDPLYAGTASTCPVIGDAMFTDQVAAGKRGAHPTPEDSVWLHQLAQNIRDQIVSNPVTYPDVVYGFCGY